MKLSSETNKNWLILVLTSVPKNDEFGNGPIIG